MKKKPTKKPRTIGKLRARRALELQRALDLLVRTGPDARRSVAAIVRGWRKRYSTANRALVRLNSSLPEDFQLSLDDVPSPAALLERLKAALSDTASEAEGLLLELRKLGPKLAKIQHPREEKAADKRAAARERLKSLAGHMEGVKKALRDPEAFAFWHQAHTDGVKAGVYEKEFSPAAYRAMLQSQVDIENALKKVARGK